MNLKIPDFYSDFFKPVPLISECQFDVKNQQFINLINQIITSPLAPDFCFKVMELRQLGKFTFKEEERVAIAEARNYLSKNLNRCSDFALFVSYLIAERYEYPRCITLSHVFLNSPLIQNNNMFKALKKEAKDNNMTHLNFTWHIDSSKCILLEKISKCEVDADIFAIAMLLAKSELLQAELEL